MERNNSVFVFHLFYKLALLTLIACLLANFLFSMARMQQVASTTHLFMLSVMKWSGIIAFFFGCYLVGLAISIRKKTKVQVRHIVVSCCCVVFGAFFLLQSQIFDTFSVLGF